MKQIFLGIKHLLKFFHKIENKVINKFMIDRIYCYKSGKVNFKQRFG